MCFLHTVPSVRLHLDVLGVFQWVPFVLCHVGFVTLSLNYSLKSGIVIVPELLFLFRIAVVLGLFLYGFHDYFLCFYKECH